MSRPSGWDVLDMDRDPTPGDVYGVRALALSAEDMALDAERLARDLNSLAGDQVVLTWIGAAGDAFREAFEEFPAQVNKLRDSYDQASEALDWWAGQLDSVQSQADRALQDGLAAQADIDTLVSQLSAARSAAGSASAGSDQLSNPPPGAPPPDPEQVRRAVSAAGAANGRVDDLNSSLSAGHGRLAAAKRMAQQARELRQNAGRQTNDRLHDAADAGIEPNSLWEDIKHAAAKVWETTVKIAMVVALVLTVVCLIVGGPLLWAILIAASAVLLADSIMKYASGSGSAWDVGLNLLGVLPGGRILATLGRAGRVGARTTTALQRGTAAGRAALGRMGTAVRRGTAPLVGRIGAVRRLGDDAGSVSIDLLTLGQAERLQRTVATFDALLGRNLPPYLRRMFEGSRWHARRQIQLLDESPSNAVELPVGKPRPPGQEGPRPPGINRVDAFDPVERIIRSFKNSQLAAIDVKTARSYLKEFADKYPPGTPIASTDSVPAALRGTDLVGKMVFEVPLQKFAIPPEILAYAKELNIVIKQIP